MELDRLDRHAVHAGLRRREALEDRQCAAAHAGILEGTLQQHPNVAPVTMPVVGPLREQDPKPAAAQRCMQGLDSDRPADGRFQGRNGRAQTLEVLGKGIEQGGAKHVAGDAADRIEVQM